MADIFAKRFQELIDQADSVASTLHTSRYTEQKTLDSDSFLAWKVKVRNLLANVCGEPSQHFKQLEQAETKSSFSNVANFTAMKAVLLATKEDYEGGYLISIKKLVQAEVFSSELDQASELLDKGYKLPAAVVAGTVLETAIRELCDRNHIAHNRHTKLETMNADLTKASVYTLLVQKQVTALADIRNNAAHGHPNQFTDADVKGMIGDIERFLAQYL